ncbi:MAG: hypothetical protein ACRDOE_24685, partial [Streptosporangiaceae bacterium]
YHSEYIRLGEVRGNVVARPTADEDFPQSWGSVRDTLVQMMQSKDPELLQIIGAPVNRPIVSHYLGLPDLVDPSDDNRAKQFSEIEALLEGPPILGPDGKPEPSVPVDPLVDDHQVHIQTIKDWAVSDAGLDAKATRPPGYANVLAHLLAHMDAEQAVAAEIALRREQVQAAGAPAIVSGSTPQEPTPTATLAE